MGREQILVLGVGWSRLWPGADFGPGANFSIRRRSSRFWPGADFGFELILGLELNFVIF